MYKLGYFGLNKQSLKRKIKNVSVDTAEVEELLSRKGTKYELVEIKNIVKTIYNNSTTNTDEPLSIFYSKQNKKKFKILMDLIEIEEKDNLEEKILEDIRTVFDEMYDNYSAGDELDNRLSEISLKYSIKIEKIEKIFYDMNEKWLEKIN